MSANPLPRTTSELEERALPHFWTGKQIEKLLLRAVREKIARREPLAVTGAPQRGHVCLHTIIGLADLHLDPQSFRLVKAVVCRRVTGEGPTLLETADRFGKSRKGLSDAFKAACAELARRVTLLD